MSVPGKGCWNSEITRGHRGLSEWELFIVLHTNTSVSEKRNRNLKRQTGCG